ncbi:hypothetical protein EI74_0218 [Mycoplasma testudineum]|uniref:Uncharacterized protein n=1 Tax=Mycoplasma testudineum TaxID=244584 RepID=A0A4R6IHA1_9MOLU|nr:hypothetical protein [Mycoplasma testudineum]OYD27058.1 hypothetical protein CG473_00185 [Mycoplasma testudineum]TDO21187.1 hypothetical protein EI74_0218 [Mycoplasma testudineum]
MKHKIYIDFEAISGPFNYSLQGYNQDPDLPFAYTIGRKNNKNWEHETHIVDFPKVESKDEILENIKYKITENLNNWFPNFKEEDITFVGFSTHLEKVILGKIFPKANIAEVLPNTNISLSKLTKSGFEQNYFPYLKEQISNNFSERDIKKLRLDKDGAIAAFAGALIFIHENQKAGKKCYSRFYIKTDIQRVIKELKIYSIDDVTRMFHIEDNYKDIMQRAELILVQRNKARVFQKKIRTYETLLKELQNYNFDSNSTVNKLMKFIEKDIQAKKAISNKFFDESKY